MEREAATLADHSPTQRLDLAASPTKPGGEGTPTDRQVMPDLYPSGHHSPRQTSILSYVKLVDENELGRLQSVVYSFITRNPKCSDREISLGTGLKINCVCGRRNELVRMNYVLEDGVKFDQETKRMVTTWVVR